jgi:hypothetical protein
MTIESNFFFTKIIFSPLKNVLRFAFDKEGPRSTICFFFPLPLIFRVKYSTYLCATSATMHSKYKIYDEQNYNVINLIWSTITL